MKKLFQYAILVDEFTTDEKGNKVYKDTRISKELTTVLAKDEKEVGFKATREVSEEDAKNPDNVRIVVKNF